MTRMWLGVLPRELCDQHLLGEHNELHKLVGSLKAGIKVGKLRDYVETHRIQERHQRLVEEMERRGMNHDSPLLYADHGREIGDIDRQGTREELASRCVDCADRFMNTADAEQVVVK